MPSLRLLRLQGIRQVRPTQHRRIKKARDMAGGQHDTMEGFREQLFGMEADGARGGPGLEGAGAAAEACG